MKKAPMVIAGNDPSLAGINYQRLPADFDVFRSNQFYFEDKYFEAKRPPWWPCIRFAGMNIFSWQKLSTTGS